MASAGAEQPSMQELIRRRRRAGFVGRRGELDAFRANFDVPPGDDRHRFLFHVHGIGGVGKTSLVREWEQLAREHGALTAYVDEAVGSVPEVMAAISAQFALQGRRCKDLNRLLTTHRERRHEAESAAAAAMSDPAQEPGRLAAPAPSAGSVTAARASLVGLGLLPGVGAFAGAVDPAQLAQGADRLRAGLSARLGSQDDVQLVLSPERVLTPVLLNELADAAKGVPWIVLFFDTYERTAPFLDGWLHELMLTDRHGALPANVIVVTAGQHPFDTARWGGYGDFVMDVPLGPFTELEARGLLAGKGVVAEPVVEEVLRLSGGLPVLVSTLAEGRPAAPDDVGDPSATAVERFLKWERDPVRRAAALACALPRRLDADVFGAAVEGICAEADVPGLFGWLRGLPFVSDRGDRVQYHDVVRAPMLRSQRKRSPRGWAEAHGRLAETFAGWRAEAEAGLDADELWGDEAWRELRLAESYHLLCAGERGALPAVLRDVVDACDVGEGEVVARRWAQVLVDAGEDADAAATGRWGRDLLAALTEGACVDALGLLVDRAGFDARGQAFARILRGRDLRESGAYEEALAEYDRAIGLDPELARAYYGRGVTRALQGDYAAAVDELGLALAIEPDDLDGLGMRGEYRRVLGRWAEAISDLDRAIEVSPADPFAWASRGAARHGLGQDDAALADLDRAVELDPEYSWALVRRARVRRSRGEYAEQIADLDLAVRLAPQSAFLACERGDALRGAGKPGEALAEYDRAIALDDAYASAYASRGAALDDLGRREEALADLDRSIDLHPSYAWALARRCNVHRLLSDYDRAFADADRASVLWPDNEWVLYQRAEALDGLKRYEEARAGLDRVLEMDPEHGLARVLRGSVLRRLGRYEEASADLGRAIEAEPDNAWAVIIRVLTSQATGRWEQALADLARYAEIGEDPDWTRAKTAEIHMWSGHPERALVVLEADTTGGNPEDAEELAKAFRMTGQWDRARDAALTLRARDAGSGAFALALAVSGAEGTAAARPLWQEVTRLWHKPDVPAAVRDCLAVVTGAAMADWPALDASLERVLAAAPPDVEWDDLAELTDFLTELLDAPDTNSPRLAPRLARVTAARDDLRSRYMG
ncbi:tetratricopeptide repeat protein [Streptomyces sp. NBC_01283]|uniref:tetratricopeptide repeat protein n=1 Tax=Streptomyces sp. NBC_01283 TaxID=2903812 RepID=UPI00352E80BA|nr:tetratricopeptide repeat protein [Streptomyces sp. NBC_01283]